MKKNFRKPGSLFHHILIYGLVFILCSFIITGCGSSSGSYTSSGDEGDSEYSGASYDGISEEVIDGENVKTGSASAINGEDVQSGSENAIIGEDVQSSSENAGSQNLTSGEESGSTDSTESDQTNSNSDDYSQKLIYTYSFSFETEEFDKSVSFIEETLDRYNGYMENSSVYGNTNRSGSMTLRIPVEHMSEFLKETGSIGTMISKDVSTQDITLEYYDVQAHLETLNTQRERLLVLLKKADSVKDITELESQISDIEYEINSYNSQMKVYDNQVDYITVYIELSEVESVSAVEDDSFITKIQKGLSENTVAVLNGLINFVIWLVTMLPYFLVLAVLVFIGLWIKRIFKRKHPDFGKKHGRSRKNAGESGKSGEE